MKTPTLPEIKKMFIVTKNKEVEEFNNLEFMLWVEYRNQVRHEQLLELNKDILKVNTITNKLNERYIKVLERIEKHLEKLIK